MGVEKKNASWAKAISVSVCFGTKSVINLQSTPALKGRIFVLHVYVRIEMVSHPLLAIVMRSKTDGQGQVIPSPPHMLAKQGTMPQPCHPIAAILLLQRTLRPGIH